MGNITTSYNQTITQTGPVVRDVATSFETLIEIVINLFFAIALFLISIYTILGFIKILKNRKTKCEHCKLMSSSYNCRTYQKKKYCLDCYKKNFNVCDICEKVVKEKLKSFHGKKVCNNCTIEKIIKCEHCKKEFGKWEMEKYNSKYYCERCKSIYKPRTFKEIIFKPTKVVPTTFKKNKFNRYCGVEIECRNKQKNKNSFIKKELKELKYSQCRDGSINSGGVEFVSRPMNGDLLLSSVNNMCNILAKKKYFIDKSCGLHIHLEVPKEINYLKKVYLFYQKFESLLFKMVPRSRQTTDFCEKYDKYYPNSPQKIFEVKTLDEFKSFVYETKSKNSIKSISSQKYFKKRYCWVNFHSIFYRKTLEIRNHSGTISSYKINKWLLLHLNILDYINKIDLTTINDLKVDERTFLSIFPNNLKDYIKERWVRFEYGRKEEEN